MPPTQRGLADHDVVELHDRVIGAWDEFLRMLSDVDFSAPSRLDGQTAGETLVHLGSWPESRPLQRILDSAADGRPRHEQVDDAALVAAHRDDPPEAIAAAVRRARDELDDWFRSAGPAEVGRTLTPSAVGELPVLSLVGAGTYELAVHALDLQPAGAVASAALLHTGLGAVLDVTGSLAHDHGIRTAVTAQTPDGGWRVTTSAGGWRTEEVDPGPYEGTGVSGTAADLLDVSAGRRQVPVLLATGRLHVQDLPAFLELAPLVDAVPGLPGRAALRAAAGGLAGVGRLLARLPRGRRRS